MNYEIKTINWIKVIFAPMDTNSVTVQVWFNAGSIYETRDNNWISHFLEHMFFKWWKKYKTPKEVTEIIDSVWWEMNASTWREHTSYFIKVAPEYVNLAVDVLSDMLVNPNFDEEEIEKEKWVIIQELKMNIDNPHKLLIDKFLNFYYWDNSYGWPVIWTEENILSFKRDDFVNYKNSLYTKDNMVIVISWDIKNKSELEENIWKLFNNLPNKKTLNKPKFIWLSENKNWFYKKWLEQNHIILAVPWVKIADDKKYTFALLSTILWWNMSSILFQELREKLWLCYYVWAYHYAFDDDGLFLIRAWLDKLNFEKWIWKINEILDSIVNKQLTEEQLEKAKWFYAGKTKMWIETSDELSDYIISQYLSTWKIIDLETTLDKLNRVSLSDIFSIVDSLAVDKRYLYYLD